MSFYCRQELGEPIQEDSRFHPIARHCLEEQFVGQDTAFPMEVTMYRSVTIALISSVLILGPHEAIARGGGHGGGGGGHGGGSFGASHGVGYSGGHTGRTFGAINAAGPARGFRAMPGSFPGARFNGRVVHQRFHHRRVFFNGGYGGYYNYCYPVWNGYVWITSCDYDY